MLISRYSEPDFDPYQDGHSISLDGDGSWRAPVAEAPLGARVQLPGSKSLTNRELVLAALADGPSLIRSPLHSRDSALMIQALRSVGTDIQEVPGDGAFGPDLRIVPGPLEGGVSIDCGLAGTVMRFMPPVAALALGPVAFDGDPHARKRPMRATIDSLRALGVEVNDDGRGTLPFSLYGTGRVAGGEVTVDASASSQFVSALLLVAARFDEGLTLRHIGDTLPSMPHIEMTVQSLAERGVEVEQPEPGVWVVAPGPIAGRELTMEPDLSNAAPFLAAALVAGGQVTIPHWPDRTTQVGDSLRELLTRYGAEVVLSDGLLTVDGGAGRLGGKAIPGIDLDLSFGGELAPTFAALAALADSPSRITGIGHLRGHETDRLAALVTEIRGLGGEAEELPDGLSITPKPLHGGSWRAYDDHRMATAGAVVGLAVPELVVDDIGSTAKTMPEFPQLWQSMLHPDVGTGAQPIAGL